MSYSIAQSTETETSGRGHITIAASAYPYLGSPDTFEQWHKALLLPEDYAVEEVTYRNGVTSFGMSIHPECYILAVSSPNIPVLDHIEQVTLTPYYGRDEHGAKLLRIEQSHWNGEKWTVL